MKSILKAIYQFCLKAIGKFASVIWPYAVTVRFRANLTKLHSLWIAREFKLIGSNTTIGYPINLRGAKYISIGNNVGIGKRTILTAWDSYKGDNFIPAISIGNNTSIGEDCHITAINSITIGNNVLMGKKITITDNSHGTTDNDSLILPPIDRPLYSKGHVIIEDNVWIGDKVTVLPNVTIGKNSIIGANALVTKDVPPNCVAGGVPAKVIKQMVELIISQR